MSACGASLEAQPAQETISVSRLRIHASGFEETTETALLCHASAPGFRARVEYRLHSRTESLFATVERLTTKNNQRYPQRRTTNHEWTRMNTNKRQDAKSENSFCAFCGEREGQEGGNPAVIGLSVEPVQDQPAHLSGAHRAAARRHQVGRSVSLVEHRSNGFLDGRGFPLQAE